MIIRFQFVDILSNFSSKTPNYWMQTILSWSAGGAIILWSVYFQISMVSGIYFGRKLLATPLTCAMCLSHNSPDKNFLWSNEDISVFYVFWRARCVIKILKSFKCKRRRYSYAFSLQKKSKNSKIYLLFWEPSYPDIKSNKL